MYIHAINQLPLLNKGKFYAMNQQKELYIMNNLTTIKHQDYFKYILDAYKKYMQSIIYYGED